MIGIWAEYLAGTHGELWRSSSMIPFARDHRPANFSRVRTNDIDIDSLRSSTGGRLYADL